MLNSLAMFESPTQWIIILVIILVLFGGSKIPEIMRGMGSGMREFKKGLREDDEEKPAASDKDKESSKTEATGKS